MPKKRSEPQQLVIFRGGFVADWAVVSALLTLEARGARFELLPDGHIRIRPRGVLLEEERAFLKAHREEARAVLAYQADDRHLFTDGVRAEEAPVNAAR